MDDLEDLRPIEDCSCITKCSCDFLSAYGTLITNWQSLFLSLTTRKLKISITLAGGRGVSCRGNSGRNGSNHTVGYKNKNNSY
jgi:hypothetical protein